MKVVAVLPDFPFYQVTTLELARKLKAHGVPQSSLFWWWRGPGDTKWRLLYVSELETVATVERVAAHTSAELGAMLPVAAITRRRLQREAPWRCELPPNLLGIGRTEADARAQLLLKLQGCDGTDCEHIDG